MTFWGAIIGASVAIIGVYLTFNHNQRIMTEERRLNVLPIITISEITDIWQNSNEVSYNAFQVLNSVNDSNYLYKLWDNVNYYQTIFYFKIGLVFLDHHLDMPDKEYILTNFIDSISNCNEVNYFYAPFAFINSGLGTAVNLIVYIGTEVIINGEKKFQPISNSLIKSLNIGEELKITFVSIDYQEVASREFIVRLNYSDIHSKKYQQEHKLKFTDNMMFDLDTSVNQELI